MNIRWLRNNCEVARVCSGSIEILLSPSAIMLIMNLINGIQATYININTVFFSSYAAQEITAKVYSKVSPSSDIQLSS